MAATPPTSATIERATLSDASQIRAIVTAAYSKYIPRLGREPAPMTADWPSLIATGDVWVLLSPPSPSPSSPTRSVLGSVLILLQPSASSTPSPYGNIEGDALLIDDLVVDPSAQGKGYGKQLMLFAEELAREKGLKALVLYTNVKMTENLRLYGKIGFKETGRRNEEGFERVFMRRDL